MVSGHKAVFTNARDARLFANYARRHGLSVLVEGNVVASSDEAIGDFLKQFNKGSAKQHLCKNCKRMSKKEFADGYIYGMWPGLQGYAYNAQFIDPSSGRKIMEHLLKETKLVENGPGGPFLHLYDGTVLSAADSNDFPQPTSEVDEGEYPPVELNENGERCLNAVQHHHTH